MKRPRHRTASSCLLALALLACGGVTVIDGLGNPPAPGRAVVIRDGRIADVAAAEGFAAPRGATVVKLPGRFVMPGLVDLRARADGSPAAAIDRAASEQILRTLLAFGVTTVRSPGAPDADGIALREAVAAGEIPGPRILTAGDPLTMTGAGFGPDGGLRERIAWLESLDLDGSEIEGTITALAERRTAVVPTLGAYRLQLFGDDPRHREDPELPLAPPTLRAIWERSAVVVDESPEDFARARAAWPKALELTKRLHDGGVPLAAGSDLPRPWVIPGVSLHRELELLHDAGIPTLEVLRIATMNGAVALGLDREIGSVEPGKVADLVVLAADPTVRLGSTRAISHVFRGGRFFDPSALLE